VSFNKENNPMIRTIKFTLLLGLITVALAPAAPATQAAGQVQPQTVTLNVEHMTCSMCPITVRKALERVPGVIRAESGYENGGVGWARVTFDGSKTDVETLTEATFEAGYPSALKAE
jgi:mercuric ion binding protein